jgi:hypothetical protein
MSDLVVTMDLATDPWEDLQSAFQDYGVVERVGVLAEGMQSGLPSIAFAIRLHDDTLVVAEMSYKFFEFVAEAFSTRWHETLSRVDEG